MLDIYVCKTIYELKQLLNSKLIHTFPCIRHEVQQNIHDT